MIRIKSYRLVPLLILVAVFILSTPLVSIAGNERGLQITLKSKIQLNQDAKNKLIGASRELVTKNFSADFARGIGGMAETKVLRQTAQGYVAETIVLNLLKNTYTAEMSRIEFSHEAGRTKLLNIQRNYQPRVTERPRMVAQDAKLQAEKQKLKILKARQVPQDPQKFNYGQAIKEAEAAEAREAHHSWWYARGLANTPCTDLALAVTATDYIHAIMSYAWGGSAAKRIGSASTKKEIMDFLKYDSSLLAWNNIGHGVTLKSGDPCYGLVQWDGAIYWDDFLLMDSSIGLYSSVSFMNSCNAFKKPISYYIWAKGPRTYIGGNINLPTFKSEYVAWYFWYYTLLARWPMATALTKGQQEWGFPVGTYGLRGDSGAF
jgi:hypothetical protein